MSNYLQANFVPNFNRFRSLFRDRLLVKDKFPEPFQRNRKWRLRLIFDMGCKAEVRWQFVRDKIGYTQSDKRCYG